MNDKTIAYLTAVPGGLGARPADYRRCGRGLEVAKGGDHGIGVSKASVSKWRFTAIDTASSCTVE